MPRNHLVILMASSGDPGDIPAIDFGVSVFDIAFHPQQDVVAVGLVSGVLELHRYAAGSTTRALRLQLHTDSVRTIAWRPDGQRK